MRVLRVLRVMKWPAVGAWLLIAVVASMFAGRVGEVETNDLRNWLPATAQSTRALDLMPAGDESLLVVYERDARITPADREAVEADRAALQGRGPAPSVDGKALLLIVPLTREQVAEGVIEGVLRSVRAEVDAGRPSGLEARLTGGPAASADFDGAFDALDEALLIVTVAVVALLLLLTYRSPVLLLLPLIAVGAASQLANALIYLCAKHFGLVVDGASAGILTVLVFGAGTDYALLVVSRYREELRRNADRHTAMRAALKQSLPAIVASAATVILALLTLVVADMNSTRGLGPVAAIGIGCALLAMTTLLPMLLVLVGRWAFWPLIPRFGGTASESHGVWGRVAGLVSRRARPIWMVTALALVCLAFGASAMTTSLAREDAFVTKPESVVGFEMLAAHYPAGSSGPVSVFSREPESARSTLEGLAGVARVDPPQPAAEGGWTLLPVVLASDPSGPDARATVVRIREALPAAVVGGETAQAVDKESTMDRDLRLIIPLILLVVFVVLVVLLRAVIAPLLLLASVVLSFGAALGTSALIFRAIGFPGVDRSVLLMGFLFLVALGVDYTIFLMTRAREEVARVGHGRGVPLALAVTGGVITSAGLVLAATFAVLAMMPIVFMMQIGILVAVGVLLDTFVVRTLLVPGLVMHVGRRSWWPGRLRLHTSADSGTLPDPAGVPPELVGRG